MRALTIALIAVLALTIALCALSHSWIQRVVLEADDFRVRAQEALLSGDERATVEHMVAMANHMASSRAVLEILTSHDDLQEARRNLVDAQACLEFGEIGECYRALAQLGEVLTHIREMEDTTLNNLW